eukprot:8117964-Heterocapsa_arctica.AAC.1
MDGSKPQRGSEAGCCEDDYDGNVNGHKKIVVNFIAERKVNVEKKETSAATSATWPIWATTTTT